MYYDDYLKWINYTAGGDRRSNVSCFHPFRMRPFQPSVSRCNSSSRSFQSCHFRKASLEVRAAQLKTEGVRFPQKSCDGMEKPAFKAEGRAKQILDPLVRLQTPLRNFTIHPVPHFWTRIFQTIKMTPTEIPSSPQGATCRKRPKHKRHHGKEQTKSHTASCSYRGRGKSRLTSQQEALGLEVRTHEKRSFMFTCLHKICLFNHNEKYFWKKKIKTLKGKKHLYFTHRLLSYKIIITGPALQTLNTKA